MTLSDSFVRSVSGDGKSKQWDKLPKGRQELLKIWDD